MPPLGSQTVRHEYQYSYLGLALSLRSPEVALSELQTSLPVSLLEAGEAELELAELREVRVPRLDSRTVSTSLSSPLVFTRPDLLDLLDLGVETHSGSLTLPLRPYSWKVSGLPSSASARLGRGEAELTRVLLTELFRLTLFSRLDIRLGLGSVNRWRLSASPGID